MQVKIRILVPPRHKTQQPVMGLTVPSNFIAFFPKGTHMKIERSGASLIFTSGTPPNITEEQIEKYEYEDCVI